MSGIGSKLTLVTAPPGFGKTSIISAWVNQAGIPVGWLSLDRRDNDLGQFFSHFISALQLLQPSLGGQAFAELSASSSFSVEGLLTDLINEIVVLPGSYMLVLDDYHLIENQLIHSGMSFFLEHLPRQIHLVIATRSDPPFPLAKLRTKGEINELRIEDLRFNLQETHTFLQTAVGNTIMPNEISALESQTEGWIAGLQLAVLSMRAHREQSSFIQSLTGSNRYIIDYLVEEVLNQQPAHVRQFLLQTSVLDRFCGDLCDAILISDLQEPLPAEAEESRTTQRPRVKSQEILEQLERSNLFLIPLDSQRHWYRYHHLFADILRHFLLTQHSSLAPVLRQRASTWFAANGLPDEAIEYACAARDWQLAADHISSNSRERFLHGEFYRLIGWVNRLPVEHQQADAELSLYYAWSLLFAGKNDEAERVLRGITKQSDPGKTFLSIGSRVLEAFLAYHRGKADGALPILTSAIQQLNCEDANPDEQLVHAIASVGLADTYRLLGQLELAEKAYREALPINQRVDNHIGILVTYRNLGDILFERAHLQRAIDIYRAGIEQSRAWAEKEFGGPYDLLPSANLFIRQAEIHFERNELEQAAEMIGKGVPLLELSGSTYRINAYYQQARITLATGDLAAAYEQIQKLRRTAAGISNSYPFAQSGRFLTDLYLRLVSMSLPSEYPVGQAYLQKEIEDWLHSVESLDLDRIPYLHDAQSVVLAHSYLFLDMPEKAVVLLMPLLETARTEGRLRSVVQRLCALARAHQALGDQASALAAISEALMIGESHGFVRSIIEEGPELRPLLQSALQRDIASQYTTRLLSMFSNPEPDGDPRARANHLLIEPLSERELEILSLVAEGLSNQQIADKTFIALSTVKKHMGAILGKLGAESRTEAIQRARMLGLI